MDIKKVLKTIFDYHRLDSSIELKQIWVDDLKNFSANEIFVAWNEFRKQDATQFKKPVSWDLVKIIKRNQNKNFHSKNKFDQTNSTAVPLRRGVDMIQDLLIEKLEKMNSTNSNLKRDLKSVNHVHEKILLCAVALNDSKVLKSPFIKILEDKLHRRENEI
jgi:hypothetical protein